MKQLAMLAVVLGLAVAPVFADPIANGNFSGGFVASHDTMLDPDGIDVGGDGSVIDDGWVVELQGADDAWTVTGGKAVRNVNNQKFTAKGFAQVVSNPDDGNYDSGDTITLKFDFVATAGDVGLTYRLYGIVGSESWLSGSQKLDRVLLSNVETGDIKNGTETLGAPENYYLKELLAGGGIGADENEGGPGPESGSKSLDYTLANDFDYFAVAFYADLDTVSGANVEVDNIQLVPEPAAVALLGLGGLVLLLRRRR